MTTRALELLNDGIAHLTTTQQWQTWLTTQRKFHHYSFGNTLLISIQNPHATQVAGYRTWQSLGRQVRRGEHGIAILAPIVRKPKKGESIDDDPERYAPRAFTTATVFDLTQTDGDDLPTIANTLEGQPPQNLFAALAQAAETLGFQVATLPIDVNGRYTYANRHITINSDLSPLHQIKTLAHEIAHGLLHTKEGPESPALRELEAESVAYVTCQELGIDSGGWTFGYVAAWAGGGDEARAAITSSGPRISQASRTILTTLKGDGA